MYYDIEKVKEIDIKSICDMYGIELKRKGENLWGKIRNEKTGSFSVNLSKNIWRDWGMAEGGDVISLVSKLENTNYGEAIKILGNKFNLPSENINEEYRLLPTPSQFKEIGVRSNRITMNLEIDLNKQTVEEVEKMYDDKKYTGTMYELSKSDKGLYHQIIDNKAIEPIKNDRVMFGDMAYKYKKETKEVEKLLYKDMLIDLETDINKRVDIYNKSRFDNKTLDELKVSFEDVEKAKEVQSMDFKDKNEAIKDLSSKLETGIKDVLNSDNYKDYLKVMSKFHKYSFRNVLLIYSQMPEATVVAGFNTWKNTFKRKINKGEKGIKIFAPSPYKKKVEEYKKGNDGKHIVTSKGEKQKEVVEKTIPAYKITHVFDVSQTSGEPLPKLAEELKGDVEKYNVFLDSLGKTTDFKIEFKNIAGESKGYCIPGKKEIAISKGMSEVQTVKTLIHEIAHANLHSEVLGKANEIDRSTKEIEAESVAFIVCNYYNIDTSDYSFDYLASWSQDDELTQLKGSLDTIQKGAAKLIDKIDSNYKEMLLENKLDKTIGKVEDKKISIKERVEIAKEIANKSNSEKKDSIKSKNKNKEMER